MERDQCASFIDAVNPVILKAGELAVESQGKVVNVGKEVELDESVSERIKQRGRAKTEIDEKVQEMILQSVEAILGTSNIKVDAEEDTPTKKLFRNSLAPVTLVIDPIDGTLEYVTASDKYSINLGMIENGSVLTALIYFPKNRRLYYLDQNKSAFLVTYTEEFRQENKEELKPPSSINQNTIYTNNRVSDEIITKLKNNGYTVIEDDGEVVWPEALLKCLSGEYTASIFHSPQIRDVLLGALIESFPNGYMVDWKGNKLSWPDGGRIPRVIFGMGDVQEKIIECLDEQKS